MIKSVSFVHLSILLLLAIPAFPQIKTGDTSPELHITNWIQHTPQQRSLEGKFRVVEFWATWCAPCLAAVPHLNELAEAFKSDSGLVFVSVSDERTPKIKSLLSKMRFNSAVVTDTAAITHRAFGISGIPYCVLIDDKMQVQWAGNPAKLTGAMLRQLLARTPIPATVEKKEIPEAVAQLYDSLNKAYSAVMNNKSITEYFHLGSILAYSKGSRWNTTGLQALYQVGIGVNLRNEIAMQLGVSPGQVQLPPSMSDICVSYCYKSTQRVKAKDVVARIARELDMEINLTDSLQDVMSLELTDTSRLFSNVSDNPDGNMVVSTSENVLTIKNNSLTSLAGALQQIFNCPVVLKTPDASGKKIDLILQTGNLDLLRSSLESYGIRAVKTQERRMIYQLRYIPSAAPKMNSGNRKK